MLHYMLKGSAVPDDPVTWRDEIPYNTDYDDVYYSIEGGLEESRHVYLNGIGLAELAQRTETLVRIGELGFGTGLNFLATAQRWPTTAPVLHYISIEKHPVSVADMARAHQNFPQIADLSARLQTCLSTRLSGVQRCWFAHNILLDVWFGDVAEVLPQLHDVCDGWYLDGFSPKTNPEMFGLEVCQHLARLSTSDTRVATFSVAGMVRRNLTESGFAVAKVPGFGRKGQCLQARYNPQKNDFEKNLRPRNVAIIGAGIAGASCAEQCVRFGHKVSVFSDSARRAASEVPFAAVAPRLSANPTARGRDIARCFAYAVQYFRQYPETILSEGAIKIPSEAFSLSRLQSACNSWSDLGEHAPKICSADQASALATMTIDTEAQYLPTAPVLNTAKIRALLLQDVIKITADITSCSRGNNGWLLLDSRGKIHSGFDAVIITAGAGLHRLLPEYTETTRIKAGSIQHYRSSSLPKVALGGWGGHLLPAKDGFWCGNPDASTEMFARWNLRGQMQQDWSAEKLSVRGHWPLCCAVEDQKGLYILAGGGGHGYTLMPLLASNIALMI